MGTGEWGRAKSGLCKVACTQENCLLLCRTASTQQAKIKNKVKNQRRTKGRQKLQNTETSTGWRGAITGEWMKYTIDILIKHVE